MGASCVLPSILLLLIMAKGHTQSVAGLSTLEFRIDVGPRVINLAVFSRPYVLIREYIKVI